MRIGIDIRSLAAGKHSGVEEYTRSLLGELFRLHPEHEFVLFFNAWNRVEPNLSFAEGFPHVTLRRFRIPNKLLNFLLWYVRYPKLDRLVGGVDVWFMPNPNFVAVSRSTKLVVTVHDLSFEWFPETFSWKQRLWHMLVNVRDLVRRADRVIAVSEATARDIHHRYGTPRQKIIPVLSGIGNAFQPIDRNDPMLVTVQQKYQLPYRFILSLGTLEPRKNLVALVQAFEAFHRTAVGELVKYELVIAGTPGWKCETLLRAVRESPMRHHIHLLGFVDEADKPALYNLASVFVYPSFYEGFGFPPLEAAASGTPVIASHSAALPETLGAAGLFIDPYRPDEILQALRQILSDREVERMLRERAPLVRSRFSWAATSEATMQVLEGKASNAESDSR